VFTQVHFLDPIYYEDYRDKSTREIADLVKHRIEERIAACA
jgi:1-acyl-sn-glycerol-3-phosphate acyltransferase